MVTGEIAKATLMLQSADMHADELARVETLFRSYMVLE